MPYTTLLLDLDHTLLDSDASERAALEQALAVVGVEDCARYLPTYHAINRALWAAVERGELAPTSVRVARFEQLIVEAELDGDPELMADTFVGGLAAYGGLYPGAREVLEELASRASLGLITNGLSEVQRVRIERLGLAPYFDAVVISSEVGVAKPKAAIFDAAFASLGAPSRAATLMVGDSLTSDMRGGVDYGISTCWYNPQERAADPSVAVTYEIRQLVELLALAA